MKKWLVVGLVGLGLLLALLVMVFATATRAPDFSAMSFGGGSSADEASHGPAPRGRTRPEDLFGDLEDDNAPGAPADAPAGVGKPQDMLEMLDKSGGRAPAGLVGGEDPALGGDDFDAAALQKPKAPPPEPPPPAAAAPTTTAEARGEPEPALDAHFAADLRVATRDRAAERKAPRAEDLAQLSRRIPPLDVYDPDAGEPASALPRMAYFENTYLGGNAAHHEQLRRLDAATERQDPPWRRAALPPQPFDGPDRAGLSVSAALDRAWIGQPSRVMLQVGLQGSARAGWRRPPLDIVAVIDDAALRSPAFVVRALGALIARLGAADRLAVRRAGDLRPLVPLSPPDLARRVLLRDPRALLDGAAPGALAETLAAAGADLDAAAESARIPGTGVVLLLVAGEDPARVAGAQAAAHRLTTEGVTVSVLEAIDDAIAPPGGWWSVAHAGHGGHHRVARGERPDAAVDDELDRLSRVVARLVRVNIRLAPGVRAVRVLGSRLLQAEEVRQVKAREEAVDARLSRTLGVSADRGDDDDGLQTVIPYFLGDDTHVILVELWVERAGAIADVSVRYKDMVRLDNGRAATHVELGALPREPGPVQAQVRQNAQGVAFAEALGKAAHAARDGDLGALEVWLKRAQKLATDAADARLVASLKRRDLQGARLGTALEVSARRRLGVGHALVARE